MMAGTALRGFGAGSTRDTTAASSSSGAWPGLQALRAPGPTLGAWRHPQQHPAGSLARPRDGHLQHPRGCIQIRRGFRWLPGLRLDRSRGAAADHRRSLQARDLSQVAAEGQRDGQSDDPQANQQPSVPSEPSTSAQDQRKSVTGKPGSMADRQGVQPSAGGSAEYAVMGVGIMPPDDAVSEEAGGLNPPWGWGKTIEVMLLWVLAFWFLGHSVVPCTLELLGLGTEDLTARGQAFMHLMVDLSELAVTLGILWHRLRGFRPRAKGLFPLRLRGKWVFQVLAACLLFPIVDWLALNSQAMMPQEADEWAASLEQSLTGGDTVTNALYFAVVSVCAPIWEEAIFRGFLLPSLARYLPVQAAVAVSAVCFAMAHFSTQRFLPLTFLGIIMGTVYVRTRNLLSCVLLHSLWNLYIFWQLAIKGGF